MKDSKKQILVIDDDKEMRSLLKDYFSESGFSVSEYSSASQAVTQMQNDHGLFAEEIDLIISDINMPGMSGLEFTETFKRINPKVPIILITAFGSIETAINSIRKGAFDYIVKPFKLEELSVTVERALEFAQLRRENKILRDEIKQSHGFSGIVGKSQSMQEVFDLIKRVAPAHANVLISGESGTGKERVARAIHDIGPRSKKPFVAINCTAIPDTLLESELFGHAKGSFTGAVQRKKGMFEEADGGTVFLDEIGDMDQALQAKLLRVIQEKRIRLVGENIDRPIDVRILAATHKDLKAAIKNGSFREDLYYRLSVIPIVIPPLRHRPEDIATLAEHFFKKFAAENASLMQGFTKEAMERLIAMPWEGNVRELENLVERCVVLGKGPYIEVGDLPSVKTNEMDTFFAQTLGTMQTLEEIEKRYIRFVLEKSGGKKEKAAQILGVNRRTLYRKEREYGWVSDEDDKNVDDEGI